MAKWHKPRYRVGMKQILFGLFLFGILIAATSAVAGEGKTAPWRYNANSRDLPFPRYERAESVWASGRCWTECGSYCTWGLVGCLQQDSQGQCVKLTDKCDRYCQRECRTMGGPFLPIEFPWD
jgi:hypothetical protein